MKIQNLLLVGLIALAISCAPSKPKDVTTIESDDALSFQIKIRDDEAGRALFAEKQVFGSECKASLEQIGGKPAIAVKTASEFSDAFIDVESLFGHTIDFSKARYLSMKVYVPANSWICALKLNFKDGKGNFGGVPEVTNNFYGNYDQWFSVMMDLQTLVPQFKNWHGEESCLPAVSLLALNPYNGHQADSSLIYVNDIVLSQTKPEGDFINAYAEKMDTTNFPFTIDFNEGEVTRRMMAYRAFEGSFQAMRKGVAGNETYAIRVKGKETLKYTAFLPIIDKVTGYPLDFRKVKRIFFSYYLTEDSEDFDGSWLFLANESWESVLLDKEFFRDYKKGSWEKVSVDIADLNFKRVRGENDVMPNVYEIRLDLNYFPGKRNIEMWVDDFGWE